MKSLAPQIFKQLLMVGGIDKYYQIVKCFRDEDLRADRQPEFTQIDCEMSFVDQEDILKQFEGLMSNLFSKFLNKNDVNFERMTYNEAIENYGIDKPDLRYELKINEVSKEVKVAETLPKNVPPIKDDPKIDVVKVGRQM